MSSSAEDDPTLNDSSDDRVEYAKEDLTLPFCVYKSGRRLLESEHDVSQDTDDDEQYIATQNVVEVTPESLGYVPPVPAADNVDFFDISKDEPNIYILEKGRSFSMQYDRPNSTKHIGTLAAKGILTKLRRASRQQPFTGVLQPRHYKECLALKGNFVLPKYPNLRFKVGKSDQGLKHLVCRGSNHSFNLCQECFSYDKNVRWYGQRIVCISCGTTKCYTVAWISVRYRGKTFFSAVTQSFAATSLYATDEIKTKSLLLWKNTKYLIQQKCPVAAQRSPIVKVFETKEDAMSEFAAISTAAYLKSHLPEERGKFINFMTSICISKNRELLTKYMKEFEVGLRSKPLPALRTDLDPIFMKIGNTEEIDLSKDLYVYSRAKYDGYYIGAKLSNRSARTHTSATLASSPVYSVHIYCNDIGIDEGKEMKRKPILKVTKENGLRIESISIQCAMIAFLLRRKAPESEIEGSGYAISLINNLFNVKDNERDQDLVHNLYAHQFGAEYEIYSLVEGLEGS